MTIVKFKIISFLVFSFSKKILLNFFHFLLKFFEIVVLTRKKTKSFAICQKNFEILYINFRVLTIKKMIFEQLL